MLRKAMASSLAAPPVPGNKKSTIVCYTRVMSRLTHETKRPTPVDTYVEKVAHVCAQLIIDRTKKQTDHELATKRELLAAILTHVIHATNGALRSTAMTELLTIAAQAPAYTTLFKLLGHRLDAKIEKAIQLLTTPHAHSSLFESTASGKQTRTTIPSQWWANNR